MTQRVGHELADDVRARSRRCLVVPQAPVGLREEVRIVIGEAPEHDAVDRRELAVDRVPVGEPAVD